MLTEEKIKDIVEVWVQNTGKLGPQTETEFTCYPDNPPYETPCSAKIIVKSDTGELIP